jgi:hypothetical protein
MPASLPPPYGVPRRDAKDGTADMHEEGSALSSRNGSWLSGFLVGISAVGRRGDGGKRGPSWTNSHQFNALQLQRDSSGSRHSLRLLLVFALWSFFVAKGWCEGRVVKDSETRLGSFVFRGPFVDGVRPRDLAVGWELGRDCIVRVREGVRCVRPHTALESACAEAVDGQNLPRRCARPSRWARPSATSPNPKSGPRDARSARKLDFGHFIESERRPDRP